MFELKMFKDLMLKIYKGSVLSKIRTQYALQHTDNIIFFTVLGGQEFCDNSTKASVIKRVIMVGQKMSKIA
jgi:hypothetical protein